MGIWECMAPVYLALNVAIGLAVYCKDWSAVSADIAAKNVSAELADEGGSGPLREAVRRLRLRHLTVSQTNM